MIQIKTATGRTNDQIKRIHNYGFMSRPLVGATAYLSFLGGVFSRGFASCVEDTRYQMALAPGEVAILDDKGNLIHLTASGIVINAAGNLNVTAQGDVSVKSAQVTVNASKVAVTAPSASFSGDVVIGGNLSATGNIQSSGAVGGQSGTFGGVSVEKHTHRYEDKITEEPIQ